jgi:KDO2-lipid IV(A) lauroyltransferase
MLAVLWVCRWLVAHLPVWLGRWIACRAGDLAYYIATGGRRAAISNMRHVLGPQARWSEVRRAAHKIFQNVALDYYDMLRVPDLSDEELQREVIFDQAGWDQIRPLVLEGKSLIMLSAHYGAIDMAGRILQAHGWHVALLADRVGGSRLFQFMRAVRERTGSEMLPHEDGIAMLRHLIQTLRAGRTVGLLADRNVTVEGNSGICVPFFGQDTLMSSAVARLALRSKALIIPCFCYREGRKYVVSIDQPIAPTATDHPEQDVETLTRKVAAIYEKYIGLHPDQWLLLSPVWPDAATSGE